MFNNVALDVFIGLVFIYLLYSLLASILKEMVATIFAYRGRMLERALEQMLDGKNIRYYWWDKLRNIAIWLWYKAELSKVKKEVIDRNVYFEKTVINNKGPKKQDLPKAVNKSDHTSEQYVTRVKLNKKAQLFAANITAHPLYKRAAEGNILYTKPAYLDAAVFSDILLEILGGTESAPLLMKDISDYVDSQLTDRQELQRILRIFISQANGDVQRFKLLIEVWYNDMMDRVSGWYKRQATVILMIIGLGIAIVFNVDSIQLYSTLSVNKTARDQLVNLAIQSKDKYTTIVDTLRVIRRDSVPAKTTADTKDTVFRIIDRTSFVSDSLLKKAKEEVSADLEQSRHILGLGWYIEDSCGPCQVLKAREDSLKQVKGSLGKADKAKKDKLKKQIAGITQTRRECFDKYRRDWDGMSILGWLLTALALSLGAPFWFDLLNKFVNLRVSGPKPQESSGSSVKVSKTVTLNKHPDPGSFG